MCVATINTSSQGQFFDLGNAGGWLQLDCLSWVTRATVENISTGRSYFSWNSWSYNEFTIVGV